MKAVTKAPMTTELTNHSPTGKRAKTVAKFSSEISLGQNRGGPGEKTCRAARTR